MVADSVTATGVQLSIAHEGTNWWYKHDHTGADCVSAETATTVTVTGLTANTSYTYKAYSNSSCSMELTTDDTDAEFLTTPDKATIIYLGERSKEIWIWWQMPSGATTFRLQKKRSHQNWSDATPLIGAAEVRSSRIR